MADFAKGPSTDTAAGDIVVISVPPDGPYGVNFVADTDGFAAVIHSFDRLPNGKFGPLQKHGGLHYGDVLFEINVSRICFFVPRNRSLMVFLLGNSFAKFEV
jgi:hypothetical protein